LIVQDLYRGRLAEQAHIVLPALTFAEKTGTFTNSGGRVQRIVQAITAADGQPSDGEIFSRLLARLSEAPAAFDPAAVLHEIAATVPAYAGLTWDGVGPTGWPLATAGAAPEEVWA